MKKTYFFLMIQALSWIILFTACKSGGSGEAYTIKMRLKEGDHFAQTMNTKMNMQAAIFNMNMNIEIGSEFDVIKSQPEEKELKMTYTRLHTSMDMGSLGGGKQNTDSILNRVNQQAVGKSLILKLNKDNQIASVSGFEGVFPSTADSVNREELKKIFSKEQVTNMMGMMFSMYPPKAVKVGESWKAATKMSMGILDMNINLTYTLKSVKDEIAEIGLEGVIDGKGSLGKDSSGMRLNLSGDQEGEIYLRMADGYLRDGHFKMNIKAAVDKAGEMGAMSNMLTMEIKGESDMKGN